MEVKINKLFVTKRALWLGTRTIPENTILWLLYSRKSSLGGFIGYFQKAYRHTQDTLWSPGNDEPIVASMNSVSEFDD